MKFSVFFRTLAVMGAGYLLLSVAYLWVPKHQSYLVVLSAQTTTHVCDTPSPAADTDTRTSLPLGVCWDGLDTSNPPQVVLNPIWTVIVDSQPSNLTMTKTGVASPTGEYFYTGVAALPLGIHTVSMQVADQSGKTAMAVPPIQLTITKPLPVNQPPTVVVGSNTSAVVGSPITLSGVITDDGLPLTISPDGLRIPTATRIVDANLDVWTIGSGTMSQSILRNGVADNGGFGSKLLWYKNSVYALGTDAGWYQWRTTTWARLGTVDPGTTTVPPTPVYLTQSWTQTSGPDVIVFGSASAPQTTATFNTPGVYIARLTVSDGLLTAMSEVTVTATAPQMNVITAVTKTTTCNLVVTGVTPPDTQPAWTFQGLYGVTNPTNAVGRSVSAPPYIGTVSVPSGVYKVTASWTRKGVPTVMAQTQNVYCS